MDRVVVNIFYNKETFELPTSINTWLFDETFGITCTCVHSLQGSYTP